MRVALGSEEGTDERPFYGSSNHTDAKRLEQVMYTSRTYLPTRPARWAHTPFLPSPLLGLIRKGYDTFYGRYLILFIGV